MVTLVVQSQQGNFNALGVWFTKGMVSIFLTFNPRMHDRFSVCI